MMIFSQDPVVYLVMTLLCRLPQAALLALFILHVVPSPAQGEDNKPWIDARFDKMAAGTRGVDIIGDNFSIEGKDTIILEGKGVGPERPGAGATIQIDPPAQISKMILRWTVGLSGGSGNTQLIIRNAQKKFLFRAGASWGGGGMRLTAGEGEGMQSIQMPIPRGVDQWPMELVIDAKEGSATLSAEGNTDSIIDERIRDNGDLSPVHAAGLHFTFYAVPSDIAEQRMFLRSLQVEIVP
jgi:hypothetical protein